MLITYDGCRLGRLDGETVGLDRGAGAGFLGGLVLALDLRWVSLGVANTVRRYHGDVAYSGFLGDRHCGKGSFSWCCIVGGGLVVRWFCKEIFCPSAGWRRADQSEGVEDGEVVPSTLAISDNESIKYCVKQICASILDK